MILDKYTFSRLEAQWLVNVHCEKCGACKNSYVKELLDVANIECDVCKVGRNKKIKSSSAVKNIGKNIIDKKDYKRIKSAYEKVINTYEKEKVEWKNEEEFLEWSLENGYKNWKILNVIDNEKGCLKCEWAPSRSRKGKDNGYDIDRIVECRLYEIEKEIEDLLEGIREKECKKKKDFCRLLSSLYNNIREVRESVGKI